jgi:hypothetical protein
MRNIPAQEQARFSAGLFFCWLGREDPGLKKKCLAKQKAYLSG